MQWNIQSKWITAKSLEQLDRAVRSSLRSWLSLPHDTPVAFFHAKAKDGWLEVPRLRYVIPPLKTRRMAKVESSTDPVMLCVATSPCFWACTRNLLRCLVSLEWSWTVARMPTGCSLSNCTLRLMDVDCVTVDRHPM